MQRKTARKKAGASFSRVQKYGLLMILLWISVWCLCRQVSSAVWPALKEVARHECRTVVVETMNRALHQELTDHPDRYQSLYFESQGGISSDPVRLNEARLSLVDAAEKALGALPKRTITVPLGALSGSVFLFDLGPGWRVHFRPEGYVEGVIVEKTEPAAINRLLFSSTLEVTATVNVILDGKASLCSVTECIPLASFLLEGTTPEYYTQ